MLKSIITFIIITASLSSSHAEQSGDLTLIKASDNTRVYAHYYRAMNNNDKIALLFHQAGSNSMEYEPVLSAFHLAGFDTLAVDQRSGGERWGIENMTVRNLGASTEYTEAYPDLEAALNYAVKRKYKNILLIGSSYSASLAIVLASKNPDKVTAVAAFSPGEYFADKDLIKTAASILQVPLYITGAGNEIRRVEEVIVRAGDNDVTYYHPAYSVHGASTLRNDKNPEGYKANQENFSQFLKRFN